jgi:hypothetical protein
MVGRLPLRAETVTCTEVQIKDRGLRLRTDLPTTCIRLWIAADVTDKKAVPARIGAKSTGPERCRGELHVVIIQLGGHERPEVMHLDFSWTWRLISRPISWRARASDGRWEYLAPSTL